MKERGDKRGRGAGLGGKIRQADLWRERSVIRHMLIYHILMFPLTKLSTIITAM